VHLGDLDAIGEPARRQGESDGARECRLDGVIPPLTWLAAEAVAEAEHRAMIASGVAGRARLQRHEIRVRGVPPHELAAAGEQRGVGVHRVGIDGEQDIDLPEELSRAKVAKRCGGRHSAQRTRPPMTVAAPPSCAAPAILSVPFDTFERSSKGMDSEANLCSNTRVEALGRPVQPG